MIEATIVFDSGRTRMRCIIRNLSETGAKLEVASVTKIPRTFDLLVDKVRPQACAVVWRSMKNWASSSSAPARCNNPGGNCRRR